MFMMLYVSPVLGMDENNMGSDPNHTNINENLDHLNLPEEWTMDAVDIDSLMKLPSTLTQLYFTHTNVNALQCIDFSGMKKESKKSMKNMILKYLGIENQNRLVQEHYFRRWNERVKSYHICLSNQHSPYDLMSTNSFTYDFTGQKYVVPVFVVIPKFSGTGKPILISVHDIMADVISVTWDSHVRARFTFRTFPEVIWNTETQTWEIPGNKSFPEIQYE